MRQYRSQGFAVLAASTLLFAATVLTGPSSALAQGTRLNYVNADIRDVIRSLGVSFSAWPSHSRV